MSLSWREQVRITLAPGRMAMVRIGRGRSAAVKDRKVVTCAAGGWQPAVEALREVFAHPNVAAADATVVLSNHFVRYLLIPWNPALATVTEELAFARTRFLQVYGEAAQNWELRLSGGKAGAAQVASAVERSLLQAVTTLLANSPLGLRSIQPALMSVFNASRTGLPKDAWLMIAEPGRLLLGLLRGGQWHSLRARPLNGETLALADILNQERLLLGLEPGNETVHLHATAGVALDTGDLRVERMPRGGATMEPSRAC